MNARKWTVELILQDAKKYDTRTAWYQANSYVFKSAQRSGILDKATAHMKKRTAPNKKWTTDILRTIAQQYSTVKQWREDGWISYRAARKTKDYSQMTSHMTDRRCSWTKDLVSQDAARFNTRKEWETNSRKAHAAARDRGWALDACRHMIRLHDPTKWSKKEDVLVEARRYQTRSEWTKASYGSYEASIRGNFLEEATMHMTRRSGTSKAELDLLSFAKQYFPKAQKMRLGRRTRDTYAQCFELDIYVPELRKGIEFNGDYWHGAGFQRSWTTDPNEYHMVKKEFFQKRGIEYLEIWENEWKEDSERCLSKVKQFLGIQS